MRYNAPLLSEILRPKELNDLNLPASTIASFQRMVDKGCLMNLLFHGGPGIGKTSAAKILVGLIDADACEINCADGTRDAAMAKRIEAFVTSVSLLSRPKVCLLDEAEFMGKETLACLRHFIESYSDNVRFVLTANAVSKFPQPLLSRLQVISFDVPLNEVIAVVERLSARYSAKFQAMGYEISAAQVRAIVERNAPDLRRIANQFQMELG